MSDRIRTARRPFPTGLATGPRGRLGRLFPPPAAGLNFCSSRLKGAFFRGRTEGACRPPRAQVGAHPSPRGPAAAGGGLRRRRDLGSGIRDPDRPPPVPRRSPCPSPPPHERGRATLLRGPCWGRVPARAPGAAAIACARSARPGLAAAGRAQAGARTRAGGGPGGGGGRAAARASGRGGPRGKLPARPGERLPRERPSGFQHHQRVGNHLGAAACRARAPSQGARGAARADRREEIGGNSSEERDLLRELEVPSRARGKGAGAARGPEVAGCVAAASARPARPLSEVLVSDGVGTARHTGS